MSYCEVKLSRDGNTQSEIKEINQCALQDYYTEKSKSPKKIVSAESYLHSRWDKENNFVISKYYLDSTSLYNLFYTKFWLH